MLFKVKNLNKFYKCMIKHLAFLSAYYKGSKLLGHFDNMDSSFFTENLAKQSQVQLTISKNCSEMQLLFCTLAYFKHCRYVTGF